ncbi:G-protein coupled receptor moody-like [Branchiostoma floridae]|uniref:G-protein coupled receptor moody-like n=1 Tax=Branchiostoma floridae TaxID=7739 RepID=A0A9J7HQA6_BRAFL|nr:G-protein coupled receptor moody-like [Branchiostoma floridae]
MAVSPALLYTFLVIMIAVIAFGIVGNLLVILAVVLCPSLRRRDNIPLASLSVSDVLFTALHPPMWILALLNPEFRLPWGLCVLQSYTTPALWGVSLCHMGCIAVYRFFRVLYRYRFPAMSSTKAVCILVAIAWLVPLLAFIPLHLHPERDVLYDDKLKRCAAVQTNSMLGKIIAALVAMILPYFVGLASYIAICLALRKSKNTMLEHNRRAATPKIKLPPPSLDTPTASTSQKRSSIALEIQEGSLGRGNNVKITLNINLVEDNTDCLPGVPETVHSTTVMTKCTWSKSQQDNLKPEHLDKEGPPQASHTSSTEDDTMSPISLTTSTISDKITPSVSSSSSRGGKETPKEMSPQSERQLMIEPDGASSGNKRRQLRRGKAYIREDHDSNFSTTIHTKPTVHDFTSGDMSRRGSSNTRVLGRIPLKKKPKQRLRLSAAEKEMLKMLVAVFMSYVICNLPMTVMVIAENGDRVPEEAFLVGMLLWAGNAALNPVIYGLMNTRFKQGYREIWNRFTRLLQ